MATIKSYTSLEQSKKLAEILPIESADMWFCPYPNDKYWYSVPIIGHADLELNQLPCWSLAALLNVLPEYNLQRTDWGNRTDYKIVVTAKDDENYASKNYDNNVDACVEMIIKLKKLNLL